MSLRPNLSELVARARADLRMGLPIVLKARDATALVAAAETVSAERLEVMRTGPGELTIAITARRSETLKATSYDGDIARILVPETADLAWVEAIADPAEDLSMPMKGPFRTVRGGDAALHRLAIRLVKSARLLPAALVSLGQGGHGTVAPEGLTTLDADLVAPHLERQVPLEEVASARLPLAVSEAGRLHVYRPEDGSEEHYAVEIGRPRRDAPVLARLHSACVTGDLMGSLKCDCGPQLRAALAQMGQEGEGVLLYLNQEGRGIGLANKMRAYALQDQGFDTVEANHRLGFEDDERDFRIGAAILRQMGFGSVRLITNNPGKIAMMEETGIAVHQRVPLHVGENPHNRAYLRTKAEKSGHMP